MELITVEEVRLGEKYDVMSAAMVDYLTNGRPAEYDERTQIEMLLIKHMLIVTEKMRDNQSF